MFFGKVAIENNRHTVQKRKQETVEELQNVRKGALEEVQKLQAQIDQVQTLAALREQKLVSEIDLLDIALQKFDAMSSSLSSEDSKKEEPQNPPQSDNLIAPAQLQQLCADLNVLWGTSPEHIQIMAQKSKECIQGYFGKFIQALEAPVIEGHGPVMVTPDPKKPALASGMLATETLQNGNF